MPKNKKTNRKQQGGGSPSPSKKATTFTVKPAGLTTAGAAEGVDAAAALLTAVDTAKGVDAEAAVEPVTLATAPYELAHKVMVKEGRPWPRETKCRS